MPFLSLRGRVALFATSLFFYPSASVAQNPPTIQAPVSPAESKAVANAPKTKTKVAANATVAGNKAAPAQKQAPANASGTAVGKAPANPDPPVPLTPGDAINAALDDEQLQGDYIPCKFSLSQLRGLVLPDVAPTLSSAQSEQLKQKIISAALAQNTLPLRQNPGLAAFVDEVKKQNFTNRTPGEALALLVGILNSYNLPFAQTTKDAIATTKKSAEDQLPDAASKAAFEKLWATLSLADDSPLEVAAAASKQAENAPGFTDNYKNAIATVATQQKQDQAFAAATGNILTAARKTVATAERPTDVGCAMSILQWKETSQAFGRLIANEYIPIQVVIRNLNRDQQFVLHDIEFEVNADPTGRFGRFFSGRDKVIVRALSSAQASSDPRGITVHSAQGIGHILSAVAPFTFPGVAVGYAASAMNTALATDLDRFWKDLTIEQGNLLNDIAFSSTANTQSVVPKQGTAMYVIFVPSRPFEEGWWTQPCVETHYLGSTDSFGHIINLQRQDADSLPDIDPSRISGRDSNTGVDIARSMRICLEPDLPQRAKRQWWSLGLTKSDDYGLIGRTSMDETAPQTPRVCEANEKPDIDNPPNPAYPGEPKCQKAPQPKMDYFRNAYRNPYHHWSPNAQAIFRELANTVVSGMHITADTQLDATITDLCTGAKDATGNLKIPDTGDLSCAVTGKNLGKFEKLQMRNSRNQLDTRIAEGPLTLTPGETGSGTLVLKSTDLRALQAADYDIFGVSKGTGVQYKTGVMLHLSTTPVIIGITPDFDFSKPSADPIAFTISGNHLGTARKIVFTDSASKTLTTDLISQSDSSATFQLLLADVKKAALAKGNVTIKLLDTEGKEIKDATRLVVYTPATAQ
jgi:hypothetical protein